MKHFTSTLAVGLCAAALGTALTAPPVLAAQSSSPPPLVRIGELTGPTPGFGGGMEHWLTVTARDRDGIISEITVEWTGENYHSVTFAHRSCLLIPGAPGDPLTMRIPVSLPGPGDYQARVHAHSVPSCGDATEQEGPQRPRRFRVAG